LAWNFLLILGCKMEQLERIREIAERVATSEGLELVEVEFLGRGPGAILRIFIDKPAGETGPDQPGGVTIDDCQNVSRQVGTILDVEDFIDRSYTLEVSSPGLDRKLSKPADFERFAGSLVKVALKGTRQENLETPRRFQARLLGMEAGKVLLDVGQGQPVPLEPGDIEKINLVVEFGPKAKPGKTPKR
jgi:ribosome maturation factor RimP